MISWPRRPTRKDQVNHSLQVLATCPVRRLDSHSLENNGKIARQIARIRSFGNISFLQCLPESLLKQLFPGRPPAREVLAHLFAFRIPCQSGVEGHAPTWVGRVGEKIGRCREQLLHKINRSWFQQSLLNVASWPLNVVIQNLFKKGLLVAEGRIEAGRINAHCLGQIGHGGAFVALPPKELEGPIQRPFGIERAGAASALERYRCEFHSFRYNNPLDS